MVELFNVTTTIEEFHGCRDVLVADEKVAPTAATEGSPLN